MQNDLKVTFFSNFLNAHQLPFCNAMSDLFGEGFKFVATEHSDGAGVSAGIKDISEEHSFCVCSYASDEAADIALKLAKESDVVIIGSAPEKYFLESVRNAVGGKLVFRYSERLFKPMYGRCIKWHSYLAIQALLNRYRNYYLLSAGAYAAEDFQKLLMPKNRMFKWGYFPVILKCGEADYAVFKENKKPRILWAGRMLDLKHPEVAVELARDLKQAGYDFSVKLIGSECEYDNVCALAEKLDVCDRVEFVGSLGREEVMEEMKKSNIFIFTSDKNEGWGVVLNEAMAYGCACVCNYEIGSAPYLIENKKNGFIYSGYDEFVEKVKFLLDNPSKRLQMGMEAKKTVETVWCAERAATNLAKLIRILRKESNEGLPEEGPCSKC